MHDLRKQFRKSDLPDKNVTQCYHVHGHKKFWKVLEAKDLTSTLEKIYPCEIYWIYLKPTFCMIKVY